MNILKFKKNNELDRRGFTLIETFVAITILMIAILGPMSIIAKFYADSTYAKNQIAATFLAQDGLETVQNLIKNNTAIRLASPNFEGGCATDDDWLDGLGACVGVDKDCNVDSFSGIVESCNDTEDREDDSDCYLTKNGAGFYGLGGEDPSYLFKRYITITDKTIEANKNNPGIDIPLQDLREAEVKVEVTWRGRGVTPSSVVVRSLIIESQCP